MKLEEGMYVRTKWGYICELVNINDFREPSMKYGVEASYLKDIMFIGDEDILKTSNSIIDLIQEGDYVNGELVTNANDVYTEDNIYIGKEVIVNHKDLIIEEEIETIVTKEQFESMSYKVED